MFFKLSISVIILIVSSSCSHISKKVNSRQTNKDYPLVYKNAIEDALNPEPSEISRNLVAINRANPNLIWKTDNKEYVLMVSYIDSNKFSPNTNIQTLRDYLWVTSSPQLKNSNKINNLGRDLLKTRLHQLLGLTPIAGSSDERTIIEFWVKPSDMFRPAADPEITDKTAGLILANDTPPWYRLWFNNLRSKQYFYSNSPVKNGAYPWTQLGYTYDWGSRNHEGLSEFVVKDSATVYINKIFISPYSYFH